MNTALRRLTRNMVAVKAKQHTASYTVSAKPQPANKNNPQGLPFLPVPPLQKTLEKYLKSVTPFLSEAEFSNTAALLKEFGADGGIGQKLQDLLNKRAANTDSWLANWWLHAAYLDFRWPVVVHSSPGLVFPERKFFMENERIEFAAKMICAAVDYKILIDKNALPLDMMGKYPLDMAQYTKIFGTCRIPGLTRDTLSYNTSSKHIIVMHNNHFFKVEVFNGNDPLDKDQIVNQLNIVVSKSQNKIPGVGLLTTEHRDTWGKAYEILLKDNASVLKEIEKSLFVVCLDNEMPSDKDINRQTTAGKQCIHGGGSSKNAGNRWYDKTVQFVIGTDGLNGLTYEHSPAEGQPIAVLTDHVVNYIDSKKYLQIPNVSATATPEELVFKLSDEVLPYINQAAINIDKLVDDLEMNCFTFRGFGKDFIKSQKLSPDSFIQMAQQLAFYRIHKTPGAHYESAATRMYLHGRTETIRSCSKESIDFANAMLNPKSGEEEKLHTLKAAIQGHKDYTIQAVSGMGVDRHLLGLKLIAIENGIEIPKLYQDPSFTRSTHMRISTSQVASKCDGFMCYGPLVEDGYACCYNPRDVDMNFGISAFKTNPVTNADSFRVALEDSLYDMQDVLLRVQKSKL